MDPIGAVRSAVYMGCGVLVGGERCGAVCIGRPCWRRVRPWKLMLLLKCRPHAHIWVVAMAHDRRHSMVHDSMSFRVGVVT